jgi:aspartate carbamoyltransferase catalytic subunit
MYQELGKINGLKIAIIGDLRYGRTTHSLAYALSLFKTDLFLVSPPSLKMRSEVIEEVNKSINVVETRDIQRVISKVDVLYVTRIQKERFPDLEEYDKVRGTYTITQNTLRKAKKNMIIMHPLPRIDEIDPEVDRSPNAKYFKQVKYGLVVRMALLSLVLGAIE